MRVWGPDTCSRVQLGGGGGAAGFRPLVEACVGVSGLYLYGTFIIYRTYYLPVLLIIYFPYFIIHSSFYILHSSFFTLYQGSAREGFVGHVCACV